MNTKINYNAILCEPTLLYNFGNAIKNKSKRDGFSGIHGLLAPKTEKIQIDETELADQLEFYLQSMLGACACSVSIPAYGRSMWATPSQIKSVLSESTAKRLKFVDRNHGMWKASEQYLKPVHDDLKKELSGLIYEHRIENQLSRIVWDFYLLLLATRESAEVPMLPSRTLTAINSLKKEPGLGSESLARLSIIKGIFTLFSKTDGIPAFHCVARRNQPLRERLDEILDDAYLLDASRMRRFFGIQANTRAIKRDLRKLVAFIAKSRPWAKDTVVAATQTAILPRSSAEVIDKVFELFPEMSSNCTTPIMIDPDHLLADMGKLLIISSQRLAFRRGENWMVICRRNKIEFFGKVESAARPPAFF